MDATLMHRRTKVRARGRVRRWGAPMGRPYGGLIKPAGGLAVAEHERQRHHTGVASSHLPRARYTLTTSGGMG